MVFRPITKFGSFYEATQKINNVLFYNDYQIALTQTQEHNAESWTSTEKTTELL